MTIAGYGDILIDLANSQKDDRQKITNVANPTKVSDYINQMKIRALKNRSVTATDN
jgi:hypothetical protein